MKKLVAFILLVACCVVLSPGAWAASVERKLPFSKKLALAFPKLYLFKFELCTDAACTEQAYAETQTIKLRSATLSFYLGVGTVETTSPAFTDVDFSQQYWLRISRSSATGFVPVGSPTKLNVVPYALWSNQVEGIGTGVGTITGVYGGDGLTGSATTGTATLSVGAGSGIAVAADTVSIAPAGVTSAHIQDGAVSSADIADGTIDTVDIRNGAVNDSKISGLISAGKLAPHAHSGVDITSGTVATARLSVGTATGTVAAGDHVHNYDASYVNVTGDTMTGTLNVNGTVRATAFQGDGSGLTNILSSHTVTIVKSVTVSPGSFNVINVPCPAGNPVAIGGGVDVNNVLTWYVTSSAPTIGGNRILLAADGQHGPPNGWQGSAYNGSGTAGPMKVSVICSK